jgi:hypothetical protein
MKKLTVQEKIQAYQWAKESILSDSYDYLCEALKAWIRRNMWMLIVSNEVLLGTFPEILEYKPEDKSIANTWWPSDERDKRIRVLEEIIEKLENMLPVEE